MKPEDKLGELMEAQEAALEAHRVHGSMDVLTAQLNEAHTKARVDYIGHNSMESFKDEGDANIEVCESQRRMSARNGPDIGVKFATPEMIAAYHEYARIRDEAARDAARTKIGQELAQQKCTWGEKQGTYNYRDYYAEAHGKTWDDAVRRWTTP
ncbi:hypothetical protein [Nocardia sp. NPDC049149]|uniref:hypothetical protein n=1 Tax=Nocardia sp. NPDC049149 TaxID=3364315 RepID=UPI0037239140